MKRYQIDITAIDQQTAATKLVEIAAMIRARKDNADHWESKVDDEASWVCATEGTP